MEQSYGSPPMSHAESLLAGQNRMLELIATRAPLADVLGDLTRFIESEAPGTLCSVLLLREGRLWQGAAPSLPEAYNKAIDGVAIGPGVGACGNAAFTRQTTLCEDLSTHPYWAGIRDLALSSGLRSCWSRPILTSTGEALGTFAIYNGEPFRPDANMERLMDVASHLAGIALELHRADETMKRRADELREADQRKDVFLAMLAHELRNPLATIRASLDLTARRGGDPETLRRAHEVMDRQSRQLARLVDDLLDLSRLTRGYIPLKTERIAMDVLIRRAVETVQPQLDAGGHCLAVRLPAQGLVVEVDPFRMIQVISNILSNAARYTESGGTITVSASRIGATVEVAITDTGMGMKPEFVDQVFELFVQADCSLDRSQGGLGIGLTLVKKIVNQHGGQVTASSPGLGMGSTFVVSLPEVVEHADVPAGSAPAVLPDDHVKHAKSDERHAPRKVLIVDDNTDIAEMLEAALAQGDRLIRLAHDGPSALEVVAEWDPDVVLLDIGLPVMDGYAVAERIRAGSGARRPKLVAMTGYGGASDRARSRESGFDLHLVKPVDLDTIEAAITPGN